jgi:hypothetical protein
MDGLVAVRSWLLDGKHHSVRTIAMASAYVANCISRLGQRHSGCCCVMCKTLEGVGVCRYNSRRPEKRSEIKEGGRVLKI